MSPKYSRYSGSWLNVLPIKNFFLKISGQQQRWPRPLPGAILIPPALLVVADSGVLFEFFRTTQHYSIFSGSHTASWGKNIVSSRTSNCMSINGGIDRQMSCMCISGGATPRIKTKA
jgi:hypothetical protein